MPDGLRSPFPRKDFPAEGSAQPYAGFQGAVGDRVSASDSWWPDRASSEGRPNVVVVLVDDLGFSDLGSFGSEIETPHLDALADGGIRLNNFNVTPICSPTRAAMLTGVHTGHRAGVGHVCHSDPGFPGYASEISEDLATMPEILRGEGYATFAVGKWHLSKDCDNGEAGPRHSWPLQKGFDRFYGFLEGFTNFHMPHRLVRDNSTVEIEKYPDDYYLTDDLTDEAVRMIKANKAARSDRPFFLYLAHGAVHAPLHAKADKIAKYADRYAEGWDAVREARLARQKSLGVMPEHTVLAPRPDQDGWEAPPWESLSDDERIVFARYMAVYAAMVESIDESVGTLRAELEAMGEWDNTILLFTSDNGASREGGATGTTSYFTHLGGQVDLAKDLARLDDIGGPKTMPHYPQGWAMACNTPFPLYKTTAHLGGRAVATIASWPARWSSHAGQIRTQYGHVSDILPTVLAATGITAPSQRGGLPLAPITGDSMLDWLDDAGVATSNTGRMFEIAGHRAYRRGRWEIASLHQPLVRFQDSEFELFDLEADPSCSTDVAAEHPEIVDELSALWESEAWDNQVFPLDSGSGFKYMIRPERNEIFVRPMKIAVGTPTVERWRSMEMLMFRGCSIDIDVTVAHGDAGHLLAHGDQGGGYSLRVEADPRGAGTLVFVHNDGHGTVTRVLAGEPLAPGAGPITLHLNRPTGGKWNMVLEVGSTPVAACDGLVPLFPMAPFQGIDVGINRRSPVDWELWEQHGPFPFTGTGLRSVTYRPHEVCQDSPYNWLEQIRDLALQYD
ncbi:MAG: arylsulfatase A-like enzyme [Glaciecola sp.]